MGESSEALNVSPRWAVAESTASIMRMETGVPLGTVTSRVTRAGGSDFTSIGSGGATGASTAGGTGAGNVKVGVGGGTGAGAAATLGVPFLATSVRWMSRDGLAFGTGRVATARVGSVTERGCEAGE